MNLGNDGEWFMVPNIRVGQYLTLELEYGWGWGSCKNGVLITINDELIFSGLAVIEYRELIMKEGRCIGLEGVFLKEDHPCNEMDFYGFSMNGGLSFDFEDNICDSWKIYLGFGTLDLTGVIPRVSGERLVSGYGSDMRLL